MYEKHFLKRNDTGFSKFSDLSRGGLGYTLLAFLQQTSKDVL